MRLVNTNTLFGVGIFSSSSSSSADPEGGALNPGERGSEVGDGGKDPGEEGIAGDGGPEPGDDGPASLSVVTPCKKKSLNT